MTARFWVGGTGTWNTTSTTNWSASSGGAGGASVPTAADTVTFDQAGTYTVTCTGALACLNLTVSAGTPTFASGTSPTFAISGSFTLTSTSVWSSTGAITFKSTITGNTITTNGVTISGAVTFNGVGGGWTLAANLTTSATVTLTNGALALSTFTLSCGIFSSTNANTRSVNFGTGNIDLTGSGTVLNMPIASGFTWSGTGGFTRSAGTTHTLNFGTNGGAVSYNAPNFTSSSGGSVTITAPGYFKNLVFLTASTVTATTVYIYGNLTLATGGNYGSSFAPNFYGSGSTFTSAGNGGFSIIVGTTGTLTLGDALSMSAAQTFTLLQGTLALNGFNMTCGVFSSNNANIRAISFGANTIDLISTTDSATVLQMTDATGFSWTGTGGFTRTAGVNATLAFDTAASLNTGGPNVTVTAGAGTTTFSLSSWFKNVTFVNNVVVTGSIKVTGNVTIPSGANATGLSIDFYASSTFTPPGLNIASFSANNGATVTLGGALTTTSSTSMFDGSTTLNLNSFALTCASFIANDNTAGRTLAFGASGSIRVGLTTLSTTVLFDLGTGSGLTTSGAKTVGIPGSIGTVVAGSLSEANALDFYIGGSGGTAGTFNFLNTAGETAGKVAFQSSFGGTWTNASGVKIYGDFTLAGTASPTTGAAITLGSTSATTRSIDTNAVSIAAPITIDGVGGAWQLVNSHLTLAAGYALTLTNGSFNANNKNVTVDTFQCNGPSSVIAILMGSGTWTINGAGSSWYFPPGNYTSLTVTPGTATVNMTAATLKSFVGGGKTWPTLNNAGAGTLYVNGSAQTFATLSNSVQPTTFGFPAGSTTTVTNFNVNGTAGNLVSVGSATAGSQFTLSKASGTVNANYLNLQDSIASGGATWNALNSTNSGNNTGWNFVASASGGRFFDFFR